MEKSFEKCLEELQIIAQKLEGADVSLDESIRLYEKAVELCKICKELLDAGEGKVAVLRKTLSGIIEEPIGE